MSEASIARNRFGLGGRPNDAVPEAPRRWLIEQFDRFDPRPKTIAALPPRSEIVGSLARYLKNTDKKKPAEPEMAAEARQRVARAKRKRAMRDDGDMGESMQDGAMDDAAMQGDAMAADSKAARERSPKQKARALARRQAREFYATAVAARAEVAMLSPTPFVERLVHFWSNHFAVSIDKLPIIGLAGAFEFEAIRPHVLGRFSDMLHAVERHPGMLVFLDQVQSIGPDSPLGQRVARRQERRKLGLNENLAREILELHTLGVRTGYTQADVTELARAMTGFSVSGLGRGGAARLVGNAGKTGDFVFAPALHEPGVRTILGKRFAENGERQASAVFDMLAAHPATARHISTKLARHFAGDTPPPALVSRLETAFLKSGGDLPTVYRVLIDAPECWVDAPVKFKNPWEWAISSLRALGTSQLPPQNIFGLMRQLGQPVWQPGSPAGYDDIAASWAGPDAILRRVEAAERMAARTRDLIDPRERAAALFPGALSPNTAQAIQRAESPGQGIALMLVAPESMRR